jgi:hypothetical protein
MLTLRVMSIGTEASKAPFYGMLPKLNILRAEGKLPEMIKIAKGGMRDSYLASIAFVLGLAVFGDIILKSIGSSIPFQTIEVWLILGLAMLLERHGAMHLQLFTTTGKVIWHWVNGALGGMWLILLSIFYEKLDPTVYSITLLTAIAVTYVPISVRHSLNSIGISYWNFEKTLFVPIITVFILVSLTFLVLFL